MSNTDKRLDKLYAGLSARERAVLVLQARKKGREEDPQVRWTVPGWQVEEFNRCIRLMNGVNVRLGHYVMVVDLLVGQLKMRLAWLQTVILWGEFASNMAGYLGLYTKEPVTQGEYRVRLKAAREEMVPVGELAEVLVDRYDAWAGEDLEAAEGDGEPEVTDAAWERVLADKESEITQLVESGVLVGKRRERGHLVNVGPFYDWLGEPCPVVPEWGSAYEVFPDGQMEEVHQLQKAQSDVLEAFRIAASLPGMEGLWPAAKKDEHLDQVRDTLLVRVREGVQLRWRELRAAEIVLEEAAREFAGEDAATPGLRRDIEEAKDTVKEIREGMKLLGEELELPEPEEELLGQVRQLVQGSS